MPYYLVIVLLNTKKCCSGEELCPKFEDEKLTLKFVAISGI
jgi:hypothetical protein